MKLYSNSDWPLEDAADLLHAAGEECYDDRCRICHPEVHRSPQWRWRRSWGRVRAGLCHCHRPCGDMDYKAAIVLAVRDHPYPRDRLAAPYRGQLP